MNKFEINITEKSEKDLKEIGRYISKELLEKELALKLVKKIGSEILSLEKLPYRNKLVYDEGLSEKGVRRLIVGNYSVFYFVNENKREVLILRILYSKREWESLL